MEVASQAAAEAVALSAAVEVVSQAAEVPVEVVVVSPAAKEAGSQGAAADRPAEVVELSSAAKLAGSRGAAVADHRTIGVAADTTAMEAACFMAAIPLDTAPITTAILTATAVITTTKADAMWFVGR